MERAINVIKTVASITDRAVLFHSASGKDSIALLDLMHPYFREILCVYMYTVKDMEHINRYIAWAQRKYHNAHFVQVPHYSTYTYIKVGFLGCKQDPKQRLWTLSDITDKVRERYGIDWAFFGFKQSDSLNRRVMLRGYTEDAICEKTKKCYPLSTYKNADILHYIEEHNLIRPETYGGEHQSAGADITDVHYLLYLREHFSGDLRKVFDMYPIAERTLFDYDNRKDEEDTTERDH